MTCRRPSDRSAAVRRGSRCVVVAQLAAQVQRPAHAQAPVPAERVTFDEAIQRAIRNNPSAAIAAAGILRAEALLAKRGRRRGCR